MIEYVAIIVHRGKAYVPVNALIDEGPYVTVEPIFIADLTMDDLVKALEQAIMAGNPRLKELPEQAGQKRKDPLLRAMKLTSWKKLAQESATYGVSWEENQLLLYLHNSDKQGEYNYDPKRVLTFPLHVSLQEVVRVILEDLEEIPRLGYPDVKTP